MDNYDQYRNVYKNTGTTPRTLGEAYKNADYATPIHTYKTDTQLAWDFLINALVGFIMVGCFAVVMVAFLVWVGVI